MRCKSENEFFRHVLRLAGLNNRHFGRTETAAKLKLGWKGMVIKMVNAEEKCTNVECKAKFDDKARLNDLLSSQKYVTFGYNTYLNECETSFVRSCIANILKEEHDIQFEVFGDLQSRGWYEPCKAEDSKLTKAQNKFSENVTK